YSNSPKHFGTIHIFDLVFSYIPLLTNQALLFIKSYKKEILPSNLFWKVSVLFLILKYSLIVEITQKTNLLLNRFNTVNVIYSFYHCLHSL
ncbi:hypothetical protein ARP45_14565, partial [Listeria monocytogenes]|nr:hypothetical protein [Listeria monocytogenes]